jgi:hypothetical protein
MGRFGQQAPMDGGFKPAPAPGPGGSYAPGPMDNGMMPARQQMMSAALMGGGPSGGYGSMASRPGLGSIMGAGAQQPQPWGNTNWPTMPGSVLMGAAGAQQPQLGQQMPTQMPPMDNMAQAQAQAQPPQVGSVAQAQDAAQAAQAQNMAATRGQSQLMPVRNRMGYA